jgi:hypothetical protein
LRFHSDAKARRLTLYQTAAAGRHEAEGLQAVEAAVLKRGPYSSRGRRGRCSATAFSICHSRHTQGCQSSLIEFSESPFRIGRGNQWRAGVNKHDIAECIDGALSRAAGEGDIEVVKALIGAGADVHVRMDAPLWWAAGEGRIDMMRALLDAGADPDIALFEAAMNGLTEIVTELCAVGVDVDHCDGLALRVAAMRGHTETVKAMLAAGAVSLDGALFSAASEGQTDTVRVLLAVGAYGRPAARHEAEKNGHAETARVLKNWRTSNQKKKRVSETT